MNIVPFSKELQGDDAVKIIAKIYNGFESKFGVPRQSGIADTVKSEIVFESTYRNPDAVRGLEDFSHIWLIWNFSECERDKFSPTVRPPRLGGNKRVGVFASRSPYRPNPIGLTVVKLEKITFDEKRGPVLTVTGADLMNGTPIYDIKPYLPKFDSIPSAVGGFADDTAAYSAEVEINEKAASAVDETTLAEIQKLLEHDPKPSYKNEDGRVYGMCYSGYEIKFTYENGKITVTEIVNE